MRAIVFEQFQGPLSLQVVADPTPPRDGVVIGVRACGLCRSDWHGWMGHDADIVLPHVPGHELAGVIEQVGADVRGFHVGDRVTVPFCVGCGTCEPCRTGQHQVCLNHYQPGFTAWGSFAERVAIPHADLNLVALPETLDFVSAASLGCRYVTSFHALVAQGELRPEQWVAVHGCGGVGLSAIQIARALGARVLAVDVNPDALAWAGKLGAEHLLLSDAADLQSRELVGQIRDLTGGGAHLSLDAVGSVETCLQSVYCLRTRGCHVQIGLMVGQQRHAPLPMHVVIAKELRIVGSHGMSAQAYAPLLRMIIDGRLDPRALVADIVTLPDVVQRLPRLAENRFAGIAVCSLG